MKPSAIVVITLRGMTLISRSWVVMTTLMIVMLFLFGPRHPRVLYEDEPLDRGRKIVAVVALAILILCFTPIPIQEFRFTP